MDSVDLSDPLRFLCGRKLSSVEFVYGDYVQLHFDGPTLTAWTQPRIEHNTTIHTWGKAGFCDALRDLIGNVVVETSVTQGEEIRIEFEDAAHVTISLRSEDYTAWGEAAMIANEHPPFWMVW